MAFRRPSSWSIRTLITVVIGLFVVWMTLVNVGVLQPETFFVLNEHDNDHTSRHFLTHPRKRRHNNGRHPHEIYLGSQHWNKKQHESTTTMDMSNTETQIIDPPPGVAENVPRLDPKDQARILEHAEKNENHDGNDPKKKKKRPNILFLYADDWRHDTLGCAGNPVVKTPYLDALAKRGIRFTHNMVTTSVCWISRVSLMTGQYMSTHKFTERFQQMPRPWNETYIPMLQTPQTKNEDGYYVGHVGKWGVNWMPGGPMDYNQEYEGSHYIDIPLPAQTPGGPTKKHVTKENEKHALHFLKNLDRPRDRPFYLGVHFFATHAEDSTEGQYFPQGKSCSTLYVNDTIPVPPTSGDEYYAKLPYFFGDYNEGRVRYNWRYDTFEKQQRMMKNMYRMATEVDKTIGAILKELHQQDELSNTVVIFTTDNGNFHGEHGLADKWFPHQESIRVPLIIMDPRMSAESRGTTNADMTLNIDLAPTILSVAGIEVPEYMQGRDISDLYLLNNTGGDEGVSPPWRTDFLYEHPIIDTKEYIPSSEALVRKDLKYFEWPDYNVTQLFDLRSDPGEVHDLINDTNYTIHVHSLKARFDELKIEAASKYRYYKLPKLD